MPPLLAIAIVIISVLLIAFGKDPMEEARIKNEQKYKGEKDPLMRAIIDYNEENNSVFTKSRGNGRVESGVSKREVIEYPDHMIPHQNRAGRNRTSTQRKQETDNNLNNNSYYPPPPVGQSPSRTLGAPTAPRSDGHMYLRGGQRLAYSGTKVFMVDSTGNRKPLPDGKYITASGQVLHVVGGEKNIASN